MDLAAINSIRLSNRRLTKRRAEKYVSSLIRLITTKYPNGHKDYYVIPGHENVSRNQPIIKFNSDDNVWTLCTESVLTIEINE
tara:strand:- start:2271 stop:2519 length:249 start_codon:yes stop_codon:yes gene_type:complete